jgi:hypothetical protein
MYTMRLIAVMAAHVTMDGVMSAAEGSFQESGVNPFGGWRLAGSLRSAATMSIEKPKMVGVKRRENWLMISVLLISYVKTVR